MSENPTLVTLEHMRYLAARTSGEDPFLGELKRAAENAGIPPIWIAPEQASLMQILLRLLHAREVVEVGTLAGYSAIAMARALPPDGRVRTIEIDPERAAFAESWVAQSDVAAKVHVLRGSGAQVLPTIAEASVDAVFLDADKGGYVSYLQECERIVRPGGLILADNAFAFGQLLDRESQDADVLAIRTFNDHVAAQVWLQGIIVPVGDGLWVCVKG